MTTRRKKHTTHANHERWIVSYADFVTLLFAFFVVMFATANADRGKAGIVAAAVRAALDGNRSGNANQVAAGMKAGGPGSQAERAKSAEQAARITKAAAELLPSMQLLEKDLHDEVQKGTVSLRMDERGLTVSFKQAAFFDSGSDLIKPTALPTIGKVGGALLKVTNSVRLEGHTDNVPISNSKFENNWALSAGRAVAVLNVLTGQFKVPRERLAVSGYADVVPVASNDSEEGRARNRRVDVVILSQYGTAGEPVRNR